MSREHDPDGPLIFPTRPPDPNTAEKLSGWATSARWLPEGMGWPELDKVREEHLRVRGRVAADIERLRTLDAKHAAEDAGYSAAFSQAHRTGIEAPPDHRTPAEQRAAERSEITISLWTGAKVLAEVVDRVRAVLVANEAEWLASLNRAAVEAEEAVREHERALAEAKAKAWRDVRLARWLKSEVNGGAFGHQPAPTGHEPMPPQFDPADHEDAFARQWHEQDLVQPVQTPDDPLALEEGEEAVVQPLSNAVRYGAAKRSVA